MASNNNNEEDPFQSPTNLPARLSVGSSNRSFGKQAAENAKSTSSAHRLDAARSVEEQELLNQLSAATSIAVKSPPPPPPPPARKSDAASTGNGINKEQVASAMQQADHALQHGVAKINHEEASTTTTSRVDMDLRNNDNAFHVIANLVLDHFGKQNITSQDVQQLDAAVPSSVRTSFVEALRHRLQHNCPANSNSQIHAMTRECERLGLASTPDFSNPLLMIGNNSTNLSPTKQPTVPPRSGAVPTVPPPSGAVSVLTAGARSEAPSSSESLARQQLMAELREASNLMAASVTPEATQFWRNHVVDLQARLRALHGGDEMTMSTSTIPTINNVKELAKANEELLAEYENQQQQGGTGPTFAAASKARGYQPHPTNGQLDDQMQAPSVVSTSVQDMNGKSMPMVDVVAPANLPGGYHFEAEIDGRRFLATVPQGGVQKGETFSCWMQNVDTPGADIPVGKWRDRLCDCTAYGFLHPMFLNAIVCPLLALGQVMTRSNLDFTGRPKGRSKIPKSPFKTMWMIVIFWLVMNAVIWTAFNLKWNKHLSLSWADITAITLLNFLMLAFGIYATANTRFALREKFSIREHRFYDVEDLICATFCMPCTICQMGRHTVSFEHAHAACCTDNGLESLNKAQRSPAGGGSAPGTATSSVMT